MNNSITLTPLGLVKSPFNTNTAPEEIRPQPAQIVLNPDYAPGLLGLEVGMDILVLFYLHLIQPDERPLQLHPRHDPANPLRGVFATRTQFRPNAIGVSVVRLEAITDNVLTVTGLDALDGSPVVDIKPYLPWFDADTRRQQFEVTPVSSLAEARAAIDRLDAEVIRLLGNRAGYVRQVVNFKQTTAEVRAPTRYAEVMRRRREQAQAAGLNPDVVEGMYKLLVEYFIREEMELIQRRKTGPAAAESG